MKKVLLYLWQLPQNILGILVIIFSGATNCVYPEDIFITKYLFGVSLGAYIILDENCTVTDIKHEKGHQVQSLYLGWLYLLVIGLPSALGNLWDRFFHKSWTSKERIDWYYSQPWEAWADKLGGVER